MRRLQRIAAAVIALLLISTALTAVSVFAEGENTGEGDSSSVVESSSSAHEESSSSEEPGSSSDDEKSSSSEPEASSSSEEEESSSSEPDEEGSSEGRRSSSSSSSSAEETYALILTHEATGISVGLSQPNDSLSIDAKAISRNDSEYSAVYEKLLDAAKGKELICSYEIILSGDEGFNSALTVIIPMDNSLITREMRVLFCPEGNSRVEASNMEVIKAISPSASSDESEDNRGNGVIKISKRLKTGVKYYFAVCEVADFVPSSGGIGLLEIMAILIGVAALVSGGLLALLWTRYNNKQRGGKKAK